MHIRLDHSESNVAVVAYGDRQKRPSLMRRTPRNSGVSKSESGDELLCILSVARPISNITVEMNCVCVGTRVKVHTPDEQYVHPAPPSRSAIRPIH